MAAKRASDVPSDTPCRLERFLCAMTETLVGARLAQVAAQREKGLAPFTRESSHPSAPGGQKERKGS